MKELRLSECKEGEIYLIKNFFNLNEPLKNQLCALGFLKNERIIVLGKNYGNYSYLVKVMGINYSIDKKICEGILVYG